MRYKCPKCKKPVSSLDHTKTSKVQNAEASQYFPFCSERCKLLDIGKWFDEDYRIPAVENTDQEED